MKNLSVLLFALCIIMIPAHGQEGHKVDIRVNGFNGDKALLAYYYWDKQFIQDTVEVKDGSFTFQGEEPLDGGIYLVVLPPQNNYFEMLLGDDQQFSLKTDTADFVKHMQIEGSKEMEVFYGDMKFIAEQRGKAIELQQKANDEAISAPAKEEVKKMLGQIDQTVKDYRNNLIKNHPGYLYTNLLKGLQEPEIPAAPVDENGVTDSTFGFRYYRAHYFDEFNFSDERLIRTPILFSRINNYLERLTYKHPDSINKAVDFIVEKAEKGGNKEMYKALVGNLLNKYANSKIMGMDAVYVHMVEKYYMSGKAFWADKEQVKNMEERALAISPTIIGRKAPNLTMKDPAGAYKVLHNVGKRYTILYFWDYDCGHCKKITPKVAKLYKEFAGKDIGLYAVSINGDAEVWKEKIKEYDLTGINVQDHARQTGFEQQYDIRSTPRIFLLDEEKKILAKYISVEQLDEILRDQLGMPAKEGKEQSK